MRLDGRIFKDRRAADQNLAGIGIVDACQVAELCTMIWEI